MTLAAAEGTMKRGFVELNSVMAKRISLRDKCLAHSKHSKNEQKNDKNDKI